MADLFRKGRSTRANYGAADLPLLKLLLREDIFLRHLFYKPASLAVEECNFRDSIFEDGGLWLAIIVQ